MSNVSAALQPYIDRGVLAGAVALVADRDGVVSVDAVGYADLATRTPMRPDSYGWIASQTKPMTVAAVMMLVDEGKLALDDPVEAYLPEFRGQMVLVERDADHRLLRRPAHPITLRNILSHTSGLPYISTLEYPSYDRFPLSDRVRLYATLPLEFEPDTGYIYSNCGLNTAGRLIELLSGQPYEEFLRERLLDPLGMTETTFWPSEEQAARLATTYAPNAAGDGLRAIPIDVIHYPVTDRAERFPFPGGGLFSTAADCARFCRMLLRGGELDGRRYLSAAALAAMTTRQTAPGVPENYGLGLQLNEDGFSHGGRLSSNMSIDLRRGKVLVWLVQQFGWVGDGSEAQAAFVAAS